MRALGVNLWECHLGVPFRSAISEEAPTTVENQISNTIASTSGLVSASPQVVDDVRRNLRERLEEASRTTLSRFEHPEDGKVDERLGKMHKDIRKAIEDNVIDQESGNKIIYLTIKGIISPEESREIVVR